MNPLYEQRHARQRLLNGGRFFGVTFPRGPAKQSVQGGTLLGAIDHVATDERGESLRQGSQASQLQQGRPGLVVQQVLREIQRDLGTLAAIMLSALGGRVKQMLYPLHLQC